MESVDRMAPYPVASAVPGAVKRGGSAANADRRQPLTAIARHVGIIVEASLVDLVRRQQLSPLNLTIDGSRAG